MSSNINHTNSLNSHPYITQFEISRTGNRDINLVKETSTDQIEQPKKNSTIGSNYVFDGVMYGEQEIERIPTIEEMVPILKNRLRYLKEELKNLSRNSADIILAEIFTIEQQLKSCESALKGEAHIPPAAQKKIDELNESIRSCTEKLADNFISQKNITNKSIIGEQIEGATRELKDWHARLSFDWLGSNYFRDCLTDCKGLVDPDFAVAYASYVELTKRVIPGAVNLRRHEVISCDPESISSVDEQKITMIRTGVISDMRNGYYSLHDLIDMKNDDRVRKQKLNEINLELSKLKSENESNISNPKLVVMQYARDKILTAEMLDQTIAERRSFLRQQMLMLVLEHVRTFEEKGCYKGSEIGFATELTLPMIHLSLLNRQAEGIDPTGWKKDEEVFMSDMAKIFEEFDNKNIYYDSKGPLVDLDGNIHLPAKYGNRKNSIKLQTFFGNISVQNNTTNDGRQAEINTVLLKKLSHFIPSDSLERVKKLIKKVNEKNDSNCYIAEEIARLALKNDMFLSVGCLSAKDRTGLVCGRIGVDYVLAKSEQFGLTNSKSKSAEKKWSEEILTGPALEICKECNLRSLTPGNVRALKLTEPNLPGIGTGQRINHFVKLTTMFVKPKSDKAEKEKLSL